MEHPRSALSGAEAMEAAVVHDCGAGAAAERGIAAALFVVAAGHAAVGAVAAPLQREAAFAEGPDRGAGRSLGSDWDQRRWASDWRSDFGISPPRRL